MAVDLKSEPLAPQCGVTIHDIRLAEAEGETLDFGGLRGKVVLVTNVASE